jgi:hypothetical protein
MFTDVAKVLGASINRRQKVSETSVNFYQTTGRNIPEDRDLCTFGH